MQRQRGYGGRSAQGGFRRSAKHAEASTALRRNPLVREASAGFVQREAAILTALVNHTHLIDVFAEELAGLELANHRLDSLRDALLDIAAHIVEVGHDAVAEALGARGLSPLVEELTGVVNHARERFALAGAVPAEAEFGLRQALVLHKRSFTLHKELRDAERALAEEATEENFEKLKDIQAQLQNTEGTEALIEEPMD